MFGRNIAGTSATIKQFTTPQIIDEYFIYLLPLVVYKATRLAICREADSRLPRAAGDLLSVGIFFTFWVISFHSGCYLFYCRVVGQW